MQSYILSILIGYLIGCFQSSYILGRLIKKIDIRSVGTGNAGASNAVISLGWKFGALIAILDIGKAILSLFIVRMIFKGDVSQIQLSFLLFLNGLFVIIGHNHPFYMNFRGGKGTASLIGMMLALDWRIAIIGILCIVLITLITDYIALGAIGLVLGLVVSTIYFKYGINSIAVSMIICSMGIYRHIPNIHNILKGTETGLRKTMK